MDVSTPFHSGPDFSCRRVLTFLLVVVSLCERLAFETKWPPAPTSDCLEMKFTPSFKVFAIAISLVRWIIK